MRCVICQHGETSPGTANVLLTRGELTMVVKGVPALMCRTCGEEYVDEDAFRSLRLTLDAAERAGVQVDVRQYAVA